MLQNNTPWVALNCLAWLARPTPPENLRKGITCLCSVTSPRYVYAFVSLRPTRNEISGAPVSKPGSYSPVNAAATSRMFLKCVRRYSPRARAPAKHNTVSVYDPYIQNPTHSFQGSQQVLLRRNELRHRHVSNRTTETR